MRQVGIVLRHSRRNAAIGGDHFGAQRFRAEVHVAGRDGVGGLHDFPFSAFFAHGALDELVAAPFETALAPGRAQSFQMAAARLAGALRLRRRWPRTDQRGFIANGAVAIDAINLHRGARLAVYFPIAVIILRKMAIVALHALFQVNVHQVQFPPCQNARDRRI